jgi:hypothetical protein
VGRLLVLGDDGVVIVVIVKVRVSQHSMHIEQKANTVSHDPQAKQ